MEYSKNESLVYCCSDYAVQGLTSQRKFIMQSEINRLFFIEKEYKFALKNIENNTNMY